jgi:hypothetical protein
VSTISSELELHATCTHPSADSRWIAVNQSEARDIARDHASRPDESVAPDRNTANDGAVRAERGPTVYERPLVLVPPAHVTPGIYNVRENHRRAAEYIVFENAARVQRYIVLDFESA